MAIEVGGIVDEFHRGIGLDEGQAIGQGHFPVGMVVPVGLAVRGDMDDLRPITAIAREGGHEPLPECLALGQHVAEG